jgi:hypothetical protein
VLGPLATAISPSISVGGVLTPETSIAVVDCAALKGIGVTVAVEVALVVSVIVGVGCAPTGNARVESSRASSRI